MRRTAVLAGQVLVGGLLGPSTALANETEDHTRNQDRWIAVEDNFAIVMPDGETFTGDAGPMDPNAPPPVGTSLFISEVLYATDDGETPGDEVGRTHIECTAQVVEWSFLCNGAFVFDPASQLFASVQLDFSDPSAEGTPFDIGVTGGTGDWFGATGAVTVTDITPAPDEPVSLYEADVLLAHK
jgi:hypothetical protein